MTLEMTLTHQPGHWRITLVDGETMTVDAHGYSREGDHYVFSLLMEGHPCFELDICTIPTSLVAYIRGGA